MPTDTVIILLTIIIAALVAIVAVLLGCILHNQHELRRKNDAIISEIRENVELRDELQRRLHDTKLSKYV